MLQPNNRPIREKKAKITMDPENNITVEITCQSQNLEEHLHRFESLVRHICGKFSVTLATVSVAIVDDDTIKGVNSRFLDKSRETDVISFDLSDETDQQQVFEMVVNYAEAQRQGKNRHHSQIGELALYITHGLLHNLGFDDAKGSEAEKMHNMEDEILQETGFGIIYKT